MHVSGGTVKVLEGPRHSPLFGRDKHDLYYDWNNMGNILSGQSDLIYVFHETTWEESIFLLGLSMFVYQQDSLDPFFCLNNPCLWQFTASQASPSSLLYSFCVWVICWVLQAYDSLSCMHRDLWHTTHSAFSLDHGLSRLDSCSYLMDIQGK